MKRVEKRTKEKKGLKLYHHRIIRSEPCAVDHVDHVVYLYFVSYGVHKTHNKLPSHTISNVKTIIGILIYLYFFFKRWSSS